MSRRRIHSYFYSRSLFSLLFVVDKGKIIATLSRLQHDHWMSGWRYSPSTEKLHPQQGEYHGEEEEKKKKADDGLHGAHERYHQVPEGGPVSGRKKPVQHKIKTTDAASCFTQTHLVILKILRSLSALSTLIPNDIPGLKKPQTTSKMLPTMTWNKPKSLACSLTAI